MQRLAMVVLVMFAFAAGIPVGKHLERNASKPTMETLPTVTEQTWRFDRDSVKANWSVENISPNVELKADQMILGFLYLVEGILTSGPDYAPFLMEALRRDMEETAKKNLEFLKGEIKPKQGKPIVRRPKDIRRMSD